MLYVLSAVFVAGFVCIAFMIREAFLVNVEQRSFELARLPDSFVGTQFLFISDIHRRVLSPKTIARLQANHRIELVCIGGDLTEKGVPLARVRHNVALLRQLAPVYFVHGNNDYKTDYRRLDIMLQELSVRILDNEAVLLEKENEAVWLVGVDDPNTKRDNLRLAFAEVNDDTVCTLLLAHDPMIAERLGDKGIDLILCGHTHGGQVCLPGYGPLYGTAGGQPIKYTAGLFRFKRQVRGGGELETQMFVSRGFGTSALPIRAFCKSEMHVITLTKTHDKGSRV